MTPALVTGEDGRRRCGWSVGSDDYRTYHDDEWGRPVVDETRLFEKVCLEGFQSGLSWITILRKRDAFRRAFADFDPATVAGFGEVDVRRLLADAGIVRHRGKIEATIANARALIALHDDGSTLAELMWGSAPRGRVRAPKDFGDVPAVTAESTALSVALRRRGFRFVGPTTMYAAMQSLGLVNDHLSGCWARPACAAERAAVLRTQPGRQG